MQKVQLSTLIDKQGIPLVVARFFMQENPTMVASVRKNSDDEEDEQIRRKDKNLYIYNDKTKIYNIIDKEVFEEYLAEMSDKYSLEKTWRSSIINDAWRFIISSKKIPIVSMDDYDDLICLKNGILDINTKELNQHSKDFYFSSKLSISYNPDAKECPNFNRFLSEVFDGDRDIIENASMLGGYLLTTHTKAEKIFFFDGPGGAGKSTLINIFKLLFVKRQRTSLDLDQLADRSDYGRYDLVWSRFNAAAEARQTYVEAEEVKKMVTGDDVIVRNIFEAPLTIRVMAKIIVGCNGMPKFQDTSDGIARRLCIFRFRKKFKSINELTEQDKKNPKIMTKDKEMFNVIKEKEMPAVLNKFIDSLNKLKSKDWDFNTSELIQEELEDYRNSIDSVREFIKDNYVVDMEAETPVSDILDEFQLLNPNNKAATNLKPQTMGIKISEILDIDKNKKRSVIPVYEFGKATGKYKKATTYPIRKVEVTPIDEHGFPEEF